MKKKVFITGVKGFIGSNVAADFLKNSWEVHGSARNPDAGNYTNSEIQIIQADISNLSKLEEQLKGVDCVIHLAALVNDWSKYEEFHKVNVEGTLNVLKACLKNQIPNVIITGSISSYGEEHSYQLKNEESDLNPEYKYFLNTLLPNRMNHYRISKTLASQKAISFANENNMNLTVLEPVWVYGEGEFSSGFYEYMKVMKFKPPFFMGSKKNKFHVIYVKDLARAYFLAATYPKKGINKYIIGNEKSQNMNHTYEIICKELGVKKPINLPFWLVYPFGLMNEIICEVFQTKNPPLLSRARVSMFYDNIEYNTEKATKELGFTSSTTLERGFKDTVEWYKQNNLL